ncbi:MAG TPA: hypothetical protein VMI35_09065 [Puia sp.]|nr:hypothetical protein [Puia sp.]
MTPAPSILDLIPQRPPFVMLDDFSYTDEKNCYGLLKVREGNIFVENGLLTEPGLVENIAQTAAARIGHICRMEGKPVPIGYIGAIQNLSVFTLPKINEEIKTEVSVKNQIFNVTVIEGKIRSHDAELARCEMKIFISNQQ